MEYRKQQFLTYDEFTRQFACDYAMPLARGGYGEIYRGVDLETNEEVAIKRRLYSVDDNALTLEKEYANTQAVPVNRFVVRYLYYGRYVTPFGTYEFLVMRYYRDGNLTSDALSWATLSVQQQQRFVGEFLLGLSHLHTHGIVHRDIKPENVLLVRYSDSEGIAFRPVIVDFGISKMMTDFPEAARAFVQNSMRIGTVTYMAPEQLRTENIDYNADLWSFGIILYELITNKHMIARKSFPETQREEAYAFWRLASEDRFPDDLRSMPQPYQQIVRKCLIVNSEERVQLARELIDLLAFQPRIAQAEAAFRRQNWEVVIDALEPIVGQADIPELETWLQQARLQQALSQPIEPDTNVPAAAIVAETIPVATVPPITNVPELPTRPPVDKPVPYTAQTELLDEPDEPIFAQKPTDDAADEDVPASVTYPAAEDVAVPENDNQPVADSALEEPELPVADVPETPVDNLPALHTDELPEALISQAVPPVDEPELPDEEVEVPVAESVDSLPETEPLVADPGADALPLTATGELTEAFHEDPSAPNLKADEHTKPAADVPDEPVFEAETPAGEISADDKQLIDNQEDDSESIVTATPQYTEAFAETPATGSVAALATETRQALPSTTPASVSGKKKMRIPSAATRLPPVKLPRLTNALDSFDTEQVKQQVKAVYESAKLSKNRPLVIGISVVTLLLLLFAIDPGQSTSTDMQLDPNESLATALKRFKEYARTYEKTGYLNPYVWAFVHCNPAYDDTIRHLAISRAEIMAGQYEALFGTRSEDISKLKRLEMKYMGHDQYLWEVRPHSLSDENCMPKK